MIFVALASFGLRPAEHGVELATGLGGTVLTASISSNEAPSTPDLPPDATLMAGQVWMIKTNDLKLIDNRGSYEWVGCGLTTAPLTADNYTPCQPGQSPIYTSYETLASDVANDKVPADTTIIFDNEPWSLTPPADKKNPVLTEQQAISLAHKNGIKIINAPYSNSPGAIETEDVAAAKAGADAVEIQAQFLDRAPNAYRGFVRKVAAAITEVNPKVIILAGLATDNGGVPTSAQNLYQEWKSTTGYVDGYWLNAAVWQAGKHGRGCAPQGCPAVAEGLLEDIGG